VRRAPPPPLYEATNGHAPGAEQLPSSGYPSSSEDEGDRRVSSRERNNRLRLRNSSPLELLEAQRHSIEKHLFCYLLLFRCVVALITSRTVFAPDEHWQSVEIAHDIVFGYGFKTWEWQDQRGEGENSGWGNGPIRSILYPAMFVGPYWILKKLGLDETPLLASTLRIRRARKLHSLLTHTADHSAKPRTGCVSLSHRSLHL
jgi:hypothetical protein